MTLGEVAGEMGDLDRAQAAFEAAARDGAARPHALRGVAQVMVARGRDPVAAVGAARAAVEASNSMDAGALRVLGDALTAAADAQEDQDKSRALASEAADAFTSALKAAGENPALLDRLASAYEKAARPEEVIRTYERILALPAGQLSSRNRAFTQNNLAFAIFSGKPDRASLERAANLSRAAAQAVPIGAILDTLGAIEAGLGNRAGAIDAFRRSLSDHPGAPAPLSRLAELLAAGSAAERDEAKKLILSVEKAPADPSLTPTTETLDRIGRVRAALGMH
jgi:tetratricopeptide (TPR) repeat protein